MGGHGRGLRNRASITFLLLPCSLWHGWVGRTRRGRWWSMFHFIPYHCRRDVGQRQEPWVFFPRNFQWDFISFEAPFGQSSRTRQETGEMHDDHRYPLNRDLLYYSLRVRKTLEIPNSFLNVPAQLIFPAIVYWSCSRETVRQRARMILYQKAQALTLCPDIRSLLNLVKEPSSCNRPFNNSTDNSGSSS